MKEKFSFSPQALFYLFTLLFSCSLYLAVEFRKETMLHPAFYTHLYLPYIFLSLLAFFINRSEIVPEKPKEPLTLKALLLLPFLFFGIFFLYTVAQETLSSSILFSHANFLPAIFINSFFALFFCFYFFEKIATAKEYAHLSERTKITHAAAYLFLMLLLSLLVGFRGLLLYAIAVSLFYTSLVVLTHLSKRFLGTKVYIFILSFCIMAGERLLPLGFIASHKTFTLFFIGFCFFLPTLFVLFPKKNTP